VLKLTWSIFLKTDVEHVALGIGEHEMSDSGSPLRITPFGRGFWIEALVFSISIFCVFVARESPRKNRSLNLFTTTF
jgi:hypothetical protein